MSGSRARIVDITKRSEFRQYLSRCLAGPPSRGCRRRTEYLDKAISKGFRKKLLILDADAVGTIEYGPPGASYYPISGEAAIVMNCIWVLRRAGGKDLGKLLVDDMMESEKDANCFVTIGLKNHWSPWFRKWQMEKLGFRPLESVNVKHKTKYAGRIFTIFLMCMPKAENAPKPTWDVKRLLEGITSCIAHPLYHPQTYEPKQILEMC